MEEQKYYSPDLMDFRLGFEYELQDMVVTDVWRPKMVETDIWPIIPQLLKGRIRVPYLASAQIEAEGWEHENTPNSYIMRSDDDLFYTLYRSPVRHEVSISRYDRCNTENTGECALFDKTIIYFGKCRCINDLRLISKLLGI